MFKYLFYTGYVFVVHLCPMKVLLFESLAFYEREKQIVLICLGSMGCGPTMGHTCLYRLSEYFWLKKLENYLFTSAVLSVVHKRDTPCKLLNFKHNATLTCA